MASVLVLERVSRTSAYFAQTAGTSALRAVSASLAISDVTGAHGFLVEMANDGAGTESFHVQVRCAHVS